MQGVNFKYKGILFTVMYNNNEISIYKLENNSYILLNDIEKEIIDKLLYNQYSYVYDSELLKSKINQNCNIENKDYVYNFLQWLENIIPLECRDNFYRNISMLSTELNIDFTLEDEIASGYSKDGGYNTINNTLTITTSSLGQLRKIANKTNNPEEFYWKNYSKTLLHELAHMASSNYDKDSKISLCGFDTYPAKKVDDQNRGLTEGFTEIISMAGVPGTIEIASGYYIEASIINQMILIIGNEVFIKAYFSNLGISDIKSKFQELIPDCDKSFQLFRNIELNYQIRKINEEQNVLSNIQSTLLDYLEMKIKNLYDDVDSEIIKNIFSMYEQFLITPEKLIVMKKNPDLYLDLSSSLEKFNQLKKLYCDDKIIK